LPSAVQLTAQPLQLLLLRSGLLLRPLLVLLGLCHPLLGCLR
jgi:hypothetical protein